MRRVLALAIVAALAQTATGKIVISEWMYNGLGTGNIGEYVEFTNTGPNAVDMSGWSFDDDSRVAGTISLSGFGVVAAGESVILTDDVAANFATNWGLSGVKIVGGSTANIGRNDEINLFDAGGTLIDRLTYGDEMYAGTVRTQNKGCSIPAADYGYSVVQSNWKLGAVGDIYASKTSLLGEVGNPGVAIHRTQADFNCDGDVDAQNLSLMVACFTGAGFDYDPLPSGCTLMPDSEGYIAADFDRDGDVDQSDFGVFQQCYSGEGNEAAALCTCGNDVPVVTDIILNTNSITPVGTGVVIEGTKATITSAGTYNIIGPLTDGQIVVDSVTSGVVTMVLKGINISNSTIAPMHIKSADAAVIVLADGTSNYISDPATYVLPVGVDEPNAALFSNDFLTISGNGSLTVYGHYNDAIASKDQLIIAGGNITVTSVDDGIRGKDYLFVQGGSLNVTATGDGLKADNAVDVGMGYIRIDGGTIGVTSGGDAIAAENSVTINGGSVNVTSGGGSTVTASDAISAKGIKAGTTLTIAGGTVSANCADDAIHSNGDIQIQNTPNITISSAKDGIAADGMVTITGGTFPSITTHGGSTGSFDDTTLSAKGIKGDLGVTISGGSITINSADDSVHSDQAINISNSATYLHITSGRDGISSGADTITNDTLSISGGTISVTTGGGSGVTASDTISAKGIKAGTTMTITGGSITVNAADDGIHCNGSVSVPSGSPGVTVYTAKDGIYGATVSIYAGTFNVTTHGGSNYTIPSTLSAKGVKGETNVTIGGGSVTVNVAEDGIHCDGVINISGGTVNISASDDGMHAETSITISNATINITKAVEGIESIIVTINSGTISIVASDDGINVTKGLVPGGTEQNDGSWLYINGGSIGINASHDGLDSNGNITMTGGTVVIQGPPSQPEAPFDFNGSFVISGGLLVASGPSSGGGGPGGQTPSTSSPQYSVKATGTLSANTFFHVRNSSGTTILTFRPIRNTYTMIFSSPSLTSGGSYSIYTGGTSTGTNFNGLFTGGTYSGGTLRKTFTVTSKVTSVTF